MSAATCSAVSAALGEPTAGSASTIASWVLLEHDGPWGEDTRDEVFAATLGPARWAELEELWVEHGLRPLLVRRPAGHPRRQRRAAPGAPRQVVVGSTRGTPFLELSDTDALRGLDLAVLAAGLPGHGTPYAGPLLAVCTNGAVDRCCALAGRPLVAALAREHPDGVWECTHLGGCRFAGNLLVLPAGQLHGRLTPEQALEVARAAAGGEVAPTGWRGSTTASAWAALALEEVRARRGLASVGDLRVLAETLHDDAVDGGDGPEPAGCDVDVALDVPGAGESWRVRLRTRVLAPRTSACTDDEPPYPTPVVAGAHPLT